MQLPESHRILFLKLMQLCVEVTDHTDVNKMGAKQMAIVLEWRDFGGWIIRTIKIIWGGCGGLR